MDLEQIRREYQLGQLHSSQLSQCPHQQFEHWLQQAIEAKLSADPTAMTIATVDSNQQPSQRIVLLKGNDQQGLRFYTNKASHKGKDLSANPSVSAHFAWLPLERQVIIRGVVEELSEQQNDRYFASRPKASQVAALVSQQSQPVDDRATLDKRFTDAMKDYAEQPVPRPSCWGGYLIKPFEFEFWQGGVNRLHDRFVYTQRDGAWQLQRLQP